MGSVLQTWTGASCALAMTRIGWTGFSRESSDRGSSKIRRESEEVKTRRCVEEGETHIDVTDCVSYAHVSVKSKNSTSTLTPAKVHIWVPVDTSVNSNSSPVQVTSLCPSGTTATGPPVYSGGTVRAFLNLHSVE